MLLADDMDWFWIIVSLCFALQALIAIVVSIVHCLKSLKKWQQASMCEGKEDTSTGLLSDCQRSWSGKNKWTEDDVVGDLNIENLVKKYKSHHGTVTNSLGILDIDWVGATVMSPNTSNLDGLP